MFCLNCMSVFEEPSRYEQKSEFWGAPCSEIFYSCPYCDSDDIIEDEPPKCDCCGDYCTEEFVETKNHSYFCNNCYTIKDIKE